MKRVIVLLVLSLVFQSAFTQSRAECRAEKKAKIEAQFIETKALMNPNNLYSKLTGLYH